MLDVLNNKQTQEPDSTEKKKNSASGNLVEYSFLFIVGSLFLFALSRTILTSTFIWIAPVNLFMINVASIIIFVLILYNRITIIATLSVLVLIGLYVLFTLEDAREQYTHFYELGLMITGRLSYRPELGLTVVWIISLLIAMPVVVFLFHNFNFWILAAGGGAILMITWVPGFTRDEMGFLFFLVSFCLILIRKTNKSSAMALLAAPVCIMLVMFFHGSLPHEGELFTRRTFRQTIGGPMTAVGDFIFELFNPVHFSFQSTGFTGAGGRLGGPVSPNARSVMTVQAPGRTYLAGATSNTYTGHSWISTLNHGDINTHGLPPSQFEMLETAAALMRGATHISDRASISLTALGLPFTENRTLSLRDFPVLGVANQLLYPYYLHTYLPMEVMTIAIGTNRTGTIFRPHRMTRLWFYAGGPDYLPVSTLSPTGDIRTPGFMSRGATYHMHFLNVNPRLSFIEDLLREAGYGTHASRGGYDGMNGVVAPIGMMQDIFTPPRPMFGSTINTFVPTPAHWPAAFPTGEVISLPGNQFGVAEMSQLVDFVIATTTPSGRRIRYIAYEEDLLHWLDIFSRDVLAAYARDVREHFLDVPDIVTDRVRDLTMQIVAGIDNDFDRVMAIRDYLLQFPYTLNPVHVPRGVCFVDHFLFVGQEGYCTYFASAMAVMARIAGIPSRYVEGFVLPPAQDPSMAVNVTNRMAHAWVEVHLEGFGWLIVEATPTYAFLMDPQIPIRPEGMFSHFDEEDYWLERMLAEWEMEGLMHGFGGGGPGGFGVTGVEEEPARGGVNAQNARWFVVALIAAILIGVSLYLLSRHWIVMYRLYKVKNLSPNEQVQVYFTGILDIVTYYTKPLTVGETPKSYGGRMGKRFAFQSDSVFFKDLINLYYKSKYSSHEVTEAELKLMEEAYYDMINFLKYVKPTPGFIYLRYIRRVGAI